MIGNRWVARPSGRMAPILAATGGTPPTPVVDISPDPVIEVRNESLITRVQTVNLFGTGPTACAVATLAAPPQGQAYRIERYTVFTTDFTGLAGLWVVAGEPGRPEVIRDGSAAWTAPIATADDPNGIYLPASTPLSFVWCASTAEHFANVQYAVLEV